MSDVMQHISDTTSGVTLTTAATNHLLAYLNKEANAIGVRLSLAKKGCSGFAYEVNFVEVADDNDIAVPFSERYFIYIEKKSYPFLKGMKMDYVKQGLNHKWLFTNPNQTGQCGCGESFTVD